MIARLSAIRIDSRPCWLPLAEPTAGDLLSFLLAPTASRAPLADALALDPSLALWTTWRFATQGCSKKTDVSVAWLADWLAENPTLFVEGSDPLQAVDAYPSWTPDCLASLAGRCVRTALATIGDNDFLADPRYLATIVGLAADELLGPGALDSAELTSCAARLAAGLSAAASAADSGSAASDARCSAECDPAGSLPERARQRWLVPAGFAVQQFIPLAARLVEHQRMATEYDHRLEAEKLASLAEFAAGAGHEINNPLAVISGRAQLFLRHEQDPERRRDLAIINTQARRVHEMIADLMLFARPPTPQPAECDVSELIDTVVAEIGPRASTAGVEIQVDCATELPPIHVDAAQIQVALRAVCENALDALAGRATGGRIEIAISEVNRDIEERSETSPLAGEGEIKHGAANEGTGWRATHVVITIGDNGPGISPEVRRHAFDPFYSGRGAGRGLGNGLSKCWRIVTLHGGTVEIDSTSAGTIVTLTLRCGGIADTGEAGFTSAAAPPVPRADGE